MEIYEEDSLTPTPDPETPDNTDNPENPDDNSGDGGDEPAPDGGGDGSSNDDIEYYD